MALSVTLSMRYESYGDLELPLIDQGISPGTAPSEQTAFAKSRFNN